jgi:hypothetical protein
MRCGLFIHFSMHNKHWDFDAIFTLVKYLDSLESGGIKAFDRDLTESLSVQQ